MVFLTLNFLDFLSTAIGIMSGRAVEANQFINWMGGPFSFAALIYKFVAIPLMILLPAFWAVNKYKNSQFALTLIGVVSGVLGYVTVHNVSLLFAKPEICPKCGNKLTKKYKCIKCDLKK